jgi:hypothetical protein
MSSLLDRPSGWGVCFAALAMTSGRYAQKDNGPINCKPQTINFKLQTINMQISWGYKIAAVYILFVIGIIMLVLKANGAEQELVTSNYYEQELRYQEVIDQKAAVAALSAPPQYNRTSGTLQVVLPSEFEGRSWKGNIYLYRPSDATLDVRKDISVTGRNYTLVLPKAAAGVYTVKFAWELNGKKYFDEKTIRF